MRIGIYGGTFNPIHIGHLHIADAAATTLNLDVVYFIPAENPYMKDQTELLPYWRRATMVRTAIEDDERFEFRDDDVTNNLTPSYMYLTVQNIKEEQFSSDELFLIMGEDSYLQFKDWYKVDTIIENINGIYVYRRDNSLWTNEQLVAMYPTLQIIVTKPEDNIHISSTIIRHRLRHKLGCQYLLPREVYRYIKYNKLYHCEELNYDF